MFSVKWIIFAALAFSALGSFEAFNPIKAISDVLPKQSVRIERLEACPDVNTPSKFDNVVINQKGFNEYSFDAILNLTKPLENPVVLKMEMYRCDKDSDHCEFYFNSKKGGFCNDLSYGLHTWDFFINRTDFPRLCPFPPKVYKMKDCSLDLTTLNNFPFSQSKWRLKAIINSKSSPMFCVLLDVDMEVVSGQRHPKV